jgi:hypothetical protein
MREASNKALKKQLVEMEAPMEARDILLYRQIARSRLPKEAKSSTGIMGSFSSWWSKPAAEDQVGAWGRVGR